MIGSCENFLAAITIRRLLIDTLSRSLGIIRGSTDKRNPCFSLYASEDERFIHVFYGLELFEVVPDDHEHMGFKMMVGRLYNAGVKVASLEDTFSQDRKTIGSWGRAMRSHDPEVLQRILLGRSAGQKRTPAIYRYDIRRRTERLADAELLRRKYCEGITTEELAVELGTTSKTIERRLARLRGQLREILVRIQ